MIHNSRVIRHNYLLCLICYASMTNEKRFHKSYCTRPLYSQIHDVTCMNENIVVIYWYGLFFVLLVANPSHSHNCSSCIPLVWPVFVLLVVDGCQLDAGYVHRVTMKNNSYDIASR